jgi:hypothetical protein
MKASYVAPPQSGITIRLTTGLEGDTADVVIVCVTADGCGRYAAMSV